MTAKFRDRIHRRPAKKRMLIIVNPYATTVSDRLRNLVVYALQGRYEVEAVSTEARDHATEIGREARDGGYDVVVAFGGDGTLNEVVNGLAGTDLPVSVLPGGSANVVCRMLGIPIDVVDATEHLLSLADEWSPRRIDLGRVGARHFVFACGAGLDATVVRTVDAHPALKRRGGPYYYGCVAVSSLYRHYLHGAPRLRVLAAGAEPLEGITAVTQNGDPYTYFGSRPIRICEQSAIDDGTLSLAVLRRAAQRDMPTLVSRLLSPNRPTCRHRQLQCVDRFAAATISSISTDRAGQPRPFPLQVDGDYIGEHTAVELRADPNALSIVA